MSPEMLGWYFTVLSFAFGACMGSFLNVCIHRIPLEQSVVAPRSHCPGCKRMIPWQENIPLFSYLALRGRCRGCGERISPRYVLVELLTALLFLLVWLDYGFSLLTPVYWLMVFALIMGTFIDFAYMILPDRVTLGGMVAGPVLSFLVPAMHATASRWEALGQSALGLAVGFGLLYAVAKVGKMVFKQDAMGFGDVKLLGAIGAFLGWQAVLFTVMFSSLVGSIVGVSFILFGKKAWQSRIPFGPYLALAAVVWILWGQDWWQLYLDLLTPSPYPAN